MADKSIRALDQSRLGAILTGDPAALHGGPPVTAMLVQNTNPAMVCPDLNLVHRGLARRGPLPLRARAVPHRDSGLRRHRAARHHLRRARRLLHRERPHLFPGGEEGDRAARGVPRESRGDPRPGPPAGRHPSRLRDDARGRSWTGRSSARACGTPRPTGSRGGQDCAPPFRKAHFLDGFETDDRRFHFKADWKRFGGRWAEMPVLPDHFDVIDRATAAKPFRLVAAPARTFLNSTFTETPGSLRREVRPTACINPADCEALGLVEGDRLTLGNEQRRGDRARDAARGPAAGGGGGGGGLAEQALRESAWASTRSPAASPASRTAAPSSTTPRCGYGSPEAPRSPQAYPIAMSSQPWAVTSARSSARITTVVVADSKMAGPLISWPGGSPSISWTGTSIQRPR